MEQPIMSYRTRPAECVLVRCRAVERAHLIVITLTVLNVDRVTMRRVERLHQIVRWLLTADDQLAEKDFVIAYRAVFRAIDLIAAGLVFNIGTPFDPDRSAFSAHISKHTMIGRIRWQRTRIDDRLWRLNAWFNISS